MKKRKKKPRPPNLAGQAAALPLADAELRGLRQYSLTNQCFFFFLLSVAMKRKWLYRPWAKSSCQGDPQKTDALSVCVHIGTAFGFLLLGKYMILTHAGIPTLSQGTKRRQAGWETSSALCAGLMAVIHSQGQSQAPAYAQKGL